MSVQYTLALFNRIAPLPVTVIPSNGCTIRVGQREESQLATWLRDKQAAKPSQFVVCSSLVGHCVEGAVF